MRVNSGGIGCGFATFSAMTSPLQTFSAPYRLVAPVIAKAIAITKNARARPMAIIWPRNQRANFAIPRSKAPSLGLVLHQKLRPSRSAGLPDQRGRLEFA